MGRLCKEVVNEVKQISIDIPKDILEKSHMSQWEKGFREIQHNLAEDE